MLIRTGMFQVVVVEGHSKASNILTLPGVTSYALDPVLNRPLGLSSEFVAGLEMNRYLHVTGTTPEQCAAVVVKNRRNALRNPLASYPADLAVDEVLAGPPLSWPLGRREAAGRADGAVVMVLAGDDRAEELSGQPVWILGEVGNDASLESRDWDSAATPAKPRHGLPTRRDRAAAMEIDFAGGRRHVRLSNCSTWRHRPGAAGRPTLEEAFEPSGSLPVNVSGGSLGVGHLLDATGLARALEVVLQLRGQAGERQLEEVEIGLAQSWRGVPTTSGAVVVMGTLGG
jgi:acetyl-CoA C-acetyltransferase